MRMRAAPRSVNHSGFYVWNLSEGIIELLVAVRSLHISTIFSAMSVTRQIRFSSASLYFEYIAKVLLVSSKAESVPPHES